jgi:glycerol-3-phosphate dehydrogenase
LGFLNAPILSRKYRLDVNKSGKIKLLHVFGGKLTTFLSLSRKAVELVTGQNLFVVIK